jgi:hypothetical protein
MTRFRVAFVRRCGAAVGGPVDADAHDDLAVGVAQVDGVHQPWALAGDEQSAGARKPCDLVLQRPVGKGACHPLAEVVHPGHERRPEPAAGWVIRPRRRSPWPLPVVT